MPERLRVFLVGVSREDLDSLRARVRRDVSLDVIGLASLSELQRGTSRVPETADAVLMTSAAVRRSADFSSTGGVSEEHGAELVEVLTAREHDVLALVADGFGNRAIANRLGISEHTVKFHLASIFGKLGVSTRTEAVTRGLQLGLIEI